ncbi:MAG TPA: hypothetical protein DCY13_02175 [Verrucomicrobiales bacterium]|nr:hypothetical protein [Verrucomicrobiales bacterium]
MKWPNHADYAEALQNPEICFDLPELQTGIVATTPLGLPRALSGNFATVYEVAGGGETHAVRCFIRQVTNQQARYAALDRYLAPLELPFMVPFEFVDRGIRVLDQLYPIVKMAWVSGAPLHQWLESRLTAKEEIAWLAADWRNLMRDLRLHRIGHGDLQHGNILVTDDGDLRLVDYDGIYVPLFARERSPELGHANFQHPQRSPAFYDERLDHFSGLLIYLSLRALAAEPALWDEFFNGDNLLATAVDLRVPACSALWPRLLKSPDDDVRRLTVLLTDYLRVAPEQVPDLESVLTAHLARVCVPTTLTFEELEEEPLTEAEIELGTAFIHRLGEPLQGPLSAMKPGRDAVGSRPASQPRFVDVFAWSALATALLALLPPFRAVAGISAMILGLLAWVVPGPHWQGARLVAGIAALVGLLCVSQHGGYRVEARRQLADLGEPLVVHQVETPKRIAPAQPLEPRSQNRPAISTSGEATIDHAEPEMQPVSRPLLPPKARPFLRLMHEWQVDDVSVSLVALSADDRHVIAATQDRLLAFRDLATQHTVFSRTNLVEPMLAITTLTNVGVVATLDAMHVVQWWSLDGGLPLKTLPVNPDSVFLPVISPHGDAIAVGGPDRRSVTLHLDRSPNAGRTIPGLSSWVKLVKFFPEGDSMVIVSHDDTIAVCDLAAGQIRQRLAFPDAAIADAAISKRRGFVAVGGRGQLRAWDLAAGRPVGELGFADQSVVGVGFVQDGRRLLIAYAEGLMELRDFAEHLPLLARHETSRRLTSLAVSSSGGSIAAGDESGRVSVWRLSAEQGDPILHVARP